jgi:hypothetical protein
MLYLELIHISQLLDMHHLQQQLLCLYSYFLSHPPPPSFPLHQHALFAPHLHTPAVGPTHVTAATPIVSLSAAAAASTNIEGSSRELEGPTVLPLPTVSTPAMAPTASPAPAPLALAPIASSDNAAVPTSATPPHALAATSSGIASAPSSAAVS